MASTFATDTESTIEFLSALFGHKGLENVSFRLWDGRVWPDEKSRPATLVLKHAGALREMLSSGTAKGLGESYLRDDFDVEGDIESAINVATTLETRPAGWLSSLKTFYQLQRLPAGLSGRGSVRTASAIDGERHTLARDRRAVQFHYDVSNQFYRLWLDEHMVYSCAYFTTPDDLLDFAQQEKLDYICRKLRLNPGEHLLDIGCGWGGLALFAARRYGVRVTGVTLSERQAEWADARVHEAGLSDMVKIELRDYRELRSAGAFDAIVTVGMAEHVGREHLPEYFKTVKNLLRAGGVFLNHAIAEGLRADRFHGPSFVHEYVFPDGDIPPLPIVLQAATAEGFEVRDVENLRDHYTLTLRHWVRRLEAAHERALAYVDEATYRVWRLYMAGSAHGFHHGDLAIYQTLLSKPTPGGDAHLPLRRDDWYR